MVYMFFFLMLYISTPMLLSADNAIPVIEKVKLVCLGITRENAVIDQLLKNLLQTKSFIIKICCCKK